LSSKSTFSNSTSKSYALALYEIANESLQLEKIEKEIKEFKNLLNKSSDLNEIILNPTVSKEEKGKIMITISEKNNFSEILKKFLGFLALKNRLFFFNKIIESFLSLVSNNKGELKAKLISSKDLSSDEKKKIENELSENFKSPLNISYSYDPDLIAGLIVQVGSIMVDTSIKTKLKKLEKNMIEV
jgi:F-type H+-transporting ATPase subunit delta